MNIKEVAKRAKVSVATVSRTVNAPHMVQPRTAERVRKAVEELGYRPNLTARALKTGRTHLIGLVVPNLIHSFFAELAHGLASVLREKGFSVVISSSDEDPELERQEIEHLLGRGVDALLVASVQKGKEDFHEVSKLKIPFILIDRLVPGLTANFVGVQDEKVGLLATEHLIGIGCRTLAHIRGTQISTALGRVAGYKKALAKHHLEIRPEYIVPVSKHDESADVAGYHAALKLLSLNPRPDGIFCFNDPVAIGAMTAILEKGLRIPEDIALVGSGNLHFDNLLRVPLSTIDQCSEMIGRRAAQMAIGLIENKNAERTKTVFLKPTLVVRDSTKRQKL